MYVNGFSFLRKPNITENAERIKSKGLNLWLRSCLVSTGNT